MFQRRRMPVLAVLALMVLLACPALAEPIYEHSEFEWLAPGLTLETIQRYLPDGWQEIYVLSARLDLPWIRVDALLGDQILTSPQSLVEMAQEGKAAAAINGDFFYIQGTKAPVGLTIAGGELIKGPSPRYPRPSITFQEGTAAIGLWSIQGQITGQGRSYPLYGYNESILPDDGIVVYDHRWGAATPGGAVEVVVAQGEVKEVRLHQPPTPLLPGTFVLTGKGAGARFLAGLRIGEGIELSWEFTPPITGIRAGITGYPLLIEDGQPTGEEPAFLKGRHPRTAVGLDKHGKVLTMVVVDGRSSFSQGMTLAELADFLLERGVWTALNLDGGGSSTLVAKRPGEAQASLVNRPPGGVRPVPNGLALFLPGPRDEIAKLHLRTCQPREVLGDPYRLREDKVPVALGGTRSFEAVGLDPFGHPVPLDPGDLAWSVIPASAGYFPKPGVFLGQRPGSALIQAAYQTDKGTATAFLRVFVGGPAARLTVEPQVLSLVPGGKTPIQVVAWDNDGYPALLEEGDYRWESDVGRIEDGVFIPDGTIAGGSLQIAFADLTLAVPVSIGEHHVSLASFVPSEGWRAQGHPQGIEAAVSYELPAEPPPIEGNTVALSYAFLDPHQTRAAYLLPAEPIILPPHTLELGFWVWGDGSGNWLRGQIRDSSGIARPVDFAPRVDWTGWRWVTAPVPQDLRPPISLERIYLVTIRPEEKTAGTVYLTGLFATYGTPPPSGLQGAEPQLGGAEGEEGFRFLIFGDSKLEVGVESSNRRIFRRLIAEAREEGADFALITGDVVAFPEDRHFRSAKRELSVLRMDYYVAPGNHDIGLGDEEAFQRHFGPLYQSFTHQDSLFILLNTARGGITPSDPEQWAWLKEQLTASDARNVFIVMHRPPFDPRPGENQGFLDPREGALFNELLIQQREKTGQRIWVIGGHIHTFWTEMRSGIRHLISAGAGAALHVPEEAGGFHHYVLVHVGPDGINYQVKKVEP